MADQRAATAASQENPASGRSFVMSALQVPLAKGGGAIRGIGEKFGANPATGTGSLSVPLALSPGRSGFGPQLSLSYDSGAGNGLFGFGWNLSAPSIARKTDKGLPHYLDREDSDVFVLSGAEDLVPVYRQDGTGAWLLDTNRDLVVHEEPIEGYLVRCYRPRIEGLFARIERWTRLDNPADVHWRSISKDNILTLYGHDANARIFDPADAGSIFAWLICETRDDKGNAVLYHYKPEDGIGVDLAQSNERNRGPADDRRRAVNRYLKRIQYGNRISLLDNNGHRPRFLSEAQIAAADWMFEVVFDYGDHDQAAPKPNDDEERNAGGALVRPWVFRRDPFSVYRSGFEVRTARLCQRVLMFHHFAGEPGVGRDCLVRSTDLTYSDEKDPSNARNPVYTFLQAVAQTGYRRNVGGYAMRSLPPVEFEYTLPVVHDAVHDVDAASLENLPIGVDGTTYQWTDLHGEGIPGILTEQAGAWFYKRNLSPLGNRPVEFAPLELVAAKPNLALAGSAAQFMDLAGDGQPDLAVLDGPMPGLYEHDEAEGWLPFRPFAARLSRDMRDPNLRFVDLDGDGHADVLITEDDAFVWHASLAEEGFGPARRVIQELDEENGPRLVFADGTQSVYLADLSGDGLTDLVRIRNGEVCYWPNLGYGRFGAKVAMDNAPHLDNPDQFDHKRIRLADIDGSGTTDIVYLHRNGVRIYFNQSGNSWSAPRSLAGFPRIDDVASIVPADLLGNGTACLVWSSSLPADARRPMRYVDLMGGQKPHLLVRTTNNLGAETRVQYAPSTKFYLRDKRDGNPWITRLPFPVHVVERVETYDHIGRNRFVTRYAYHHGYFGGEEREFRGFGMVEQWDTEEIAALAGGDFPAGNFAAASHVPPVHTKTWFHTGLYLGGNRVSNYFAGLLNATDQGEYFREPGLTDAEARALLLPDTLLPPGLTLQEEREACRALKGSMLRQEVYADDAGSGATPEQIRRARTPYTVTEQTFSIRTLQPRGRNRHAVFFAHANEAINFHYERSPADPRIQHALTLEVDAYGNVLKEAAVGYGRRATIRLANAQGQVQQVPNPGLVGLATSDQTKQTTALVTFTQNRVSKSIESAEAHRNPLPCEAITFELTGYTPTGPAGRYRPLDFVEPDPAQPGRLHHKFTTPEVAYEDTAAGSQRRRPIEWLRTLYRRDDLTNLLPLGELHPLGLPGESYKLALTSGLLAQVFQRPRASQPPEDLLPHPASVLEGQASDRGGYVQSQRLRADGLFPATDADDHWWLPSGRSFFTVNPAANAATELGQARQHFFLPRRYRDPFGQDAFVDFDGNDLLMVETRDALGNRVTVEANDYRVLQPRLVSDPNLNRTEVAFDTLGMVAGTAVMGKPLPAPVEGDSLAGFDADLSLAQIDDFMAQPRRPRPASVESEAAPIVHNLLASATTRIVYDLHRYMRVGEPPFAATVARETHVSDLQPGQQSKLQLSFSYSDGFGREIQKKIQAEPGPLVEGGQAISPRWVGSGWTIFNNKGRPVRQYEPFFSDTHDFQFGVMVGISPVLFYDPAERVIATLHSNHTFEKAVFDPWQQTTYDVNDTCAPHNTQTGDPRTDPDIAGYVAAYFKAQPAGWQTWRAQRNTTSALGPHERAAAARAADHADTPTTAHFDALGRPFLTVARNRVVCAGHDLDGTEDSFATRVELDIEGNQRAVLDERKLPVNGLPVGAPEQRIVMRYAYDMLGNRIHQQSMEAGARWMLNDVAGKPIRAWDSRGHNFVTAYDALRRPVEQYVVGTSTESDPRTRNVPNPNGLLADKIEYGEPPLNASPADEARMQRLNLRTRIYQHFDSAGIATNARLDANGSPTVAYDFKSNLLRTTRRLATLYKEIPDWSQNPQPLLDDERFEASTTRYDALNRPIQSVAPHSSVVRAQHPNRINVVQPVFNEANLLERVHVWLERANEPTALLGPNSAAPVGVANIDYDAKGQRTLIDYKTQGTQVIRTAYTYDNETFRLAHLYTRRGVDPQTSLGIAFGEDCENPVPPPDTIPGPVTPPAGKGCGLQNLHYTYDPAGNITHIRDDAQQTIYFKNQRVEPSNDYTYDALYRLIQASGREHLGQGEAPIPHSYNDAGRVGVLSANPAGRFAPDDASAMGTYTERYVYDAVGNFLRMRHERRDAAAPGWTRRYAYAEASLIEPLKQSNRLSSTTVGNAPSEVYGHDAHGNMLRMPQLQDMLWDFKDQLRLTRRQRVNDDDADGVGHEGERTYYVYDASGQRVRKVTELSAGGVKDERIYLGAFEIYRKHGGAVGPVDAGTATLERETLHVMDDKQRIALVETRSLDRFGNDRAPRQLIRYQFGNHLGSANLELDEKALTISYEELAPYGSSTYQAVRSQNETAKRYRHTGMERDEESGLLYHGARFYAPWFARWVSCDPVSVGGGLNLFTYAFNNPVRYVDLDGRIPTAGDLASKWEKHAWVTTFVPGVKGEDVVAGVDKAIDRFTAWGEDNAFKTGVPAIDEATQLQRNVGATVLKTVGIVLGSAVATVADPAFVVRGIMHLGEGAAAGYENIEKGNVAVGVSQVVGDVSQAILVAAPAIKTSLSVTRMGTGLADAAMQGLEQGAKEVHRAANESPKVADYYATDTGESVPLRTPGGVGIQPHVAERMANPPPGRRIVGVEEVDAIVERGKVKKVEIDTQGKNAPPGLVDPNDPSTWRTSVTLEVEDMRPKPSVAINPDTNSLITVVVPEKTPTITTRKP